MRLPFTKLLSLLTLSIIPLTMLCIYLLLTYLPDISMPFNHIYVIYLCIIYIYLLYIYYSSYISILFYPAIYISIILYPAIYGFIIYGFMLFNSVWYMGAFCFAGWLGDLVEAQGARSRPLPPAAWSPGSVQVFLFTISYCSRNPRFANS